MKLIVTAVFPPEPIVSANISKDIAESLGTIKNNVLVISPEPTRPYGHNFQEITTSFPFSHFVVKSYVCPKSKLFGRLRESWSFGLATRKVIINNHKKISAIYINTWPLFAQFFAVKTAKKFNIPLVMHVQDIYPESLTKKLSPFLSYLVYKCFIGIDKFNFRNATKIIAISENMKKYLVTTRGVSSNKINVVRNWQNDENFLNYKPEKKEKDCPFTFMYVGSISASAGVDFIIKSYNSLRNLKNVRLVIAGAGSEKQKCMKIAATNSTIEFWDAPNDKIADIQSKADVLILSLKKGIGLTASPSKFTAYLFSKKPVIASLDIESDTANSIRQSDCGFVCPPENDQALAKTMSKVINLDKIELEKMGHQGYEYALKHLSKKENLKKITNIINHI